MKVICYANLNSLNSPENITDEQMKAFFTAYINNPEIEIIDVIIDRYTPDVFFAHRDGWKRISKLCSSEKIEAIVVPSSRMLATPIHDVIRMNIEINKQYGCGVCYLYEKLCSIDDDYDKQLQFFMITEDDIKRRKKREIEMRSTFAEVTGIKDGSCAIPVFIDAPQYRKVEEFAYPYGVDVDKILKWFFDAIVEPKNFEKFDELFDF